MSNCGPPSDLFLPTHLSYNLCLNSNLLNSLCALKHCLPYSCLCQDNFTNLPAPISTLIITIILGVPNHYFLCTYIYLFSEIFSCPDICKYAIHIYILSDESLFVRVWSLDFVYGWSLVCLYVSMCK